MKTILKELQQLYEAILSKEKTELHLKNLDRLLIQKEQNFRQSELLLDKEARDIERLEGKNLYAIFAFVLGNKETQLEKERQEYLQVYLQNRSTADCLMKLKKERADLLKSYSSKFQVEKEFDQLLHKAQNKIRQLYPDLATKILFFERNIANHKAKISEINQAIREGKKLIDVFQSIFVQLTDISDWGHQVKAAAKKSRTAKRQLEKTVHRSENHLLKFEKELYDISDHYELDYTHQIEEIQDFISRFYDSLITDWIIKEDIENSRHFVASSSDKITRIVSMLEQHKRETERYIKQEKIDKRAFVVEHINK